jgi:aminoglycoside/choline kinase family phosphotransferase
VKLPALDEAAVFTSTVLSMYLREVRFFDQLAGQSPIRVPACHHASSDDATSAFVLVMEDLGGFRMVDQTEGMRLEDAEQAVDGLARWHATWWGKADALAEAGVTLSLGDPIYPAVVPMVFGEGWEKITATDIEVPAAIQGLRARFDAAVPGLLADLCRGPNTMIHGDYRADNLVFAADGSVAAFDFQLIGTGSGAYDLAYFITQSLEVEVATAHERALFDRWIAGLTAAGVPDVDPDQLWEDYRKAALFCLVYPIIASRGMDLDDPRQRDLVVCMMRRFDRAVRELDLAQLL